MSDQHRSTSERLAWLSYPLLIFAVSRGLILAFAGSAGLFGGSLGQPAGPPSSFLREHKLWGTFAHGDLANVARVAGNGYRSLADASYFPLVPWLGKGLGAVLGSIDGALIVLSLLGCGVAFVGVYRLFESLRGSAAARAGVALLAAFPFSYHLSDGSALACALALAVWGLVLARRGSTVPAAGVLALAVLAHPASIFSGLAAACLPERAWWRRALVLLVPGCALVSWPLYLRAHLGVGTAVLWHAWWSKGPLASPAWTALLACLGGLAGVGVLFLVRGPQLRALALVGGAMLGAVLYAWQPGAAHALVLVWPAFLGLAALLAERQAWCGPLVAMLGAQQGLLLYGYTHFLRLT